MKLYVSKNEGGRMGESWFVEEREVASVDAAMLYLMDITDSEEEWDEEEMNETFDEAVSRQSNELLQSFDAEGGVVAGGEFTTGYSFKSPEDASHRYFKYMAERNNTEEGEEGGEK